MADVVDGDNDCDGSEGLQLQLALLVGVEEDSTAPGHGGMTRGGHWSWDRPGDDDILFG